LCGSKVKDKLTEKYLYFYGRQDNLL